MESPEERRSRSLTDADIEALADALQGKLIKKFYQDLGRGIWAMAWRTIIAAIVGIAAYGAFLRGQG